MIYQHEYPIRLRRHLEGRAAALVSSANQLGVMADLGIHDDAALREIAAIIRDTASVIHDLATVKAEAGALLQGHVLSPRRNSGGAA